MTLCCFNISTSIMLKPVVIECGHRFCDSCSKRLAEGPMTKRKCPSCRWPIDSDQGLSVNITLTSMLSSFAVKCKNEGCEWNGRLGDSPFHEKGCMFKKFDCEFRSQRYTVKCRRQDFEAHKNKCNFRPQECGHCWKIMSLLKLPCHRKEDCIKKQVVCPYYKAKIGTHSIKI